MFSWSCPRFWELHVCCSVHFSEVRYGAFLKTALNLSWNGCLILRVLDETVTFVFCLLPEGDSV